MTTKNECNIYTAISIGITGTILVAYLFQIVRLKYSRNHTRNKLTLKPYYVVMASVVCYLVYYLLEDTYIRNLNNSLAQSRQNFWTSSAVCFFWICVILVQTFEWQIITKMIKF